MAWDWVRLIDDTLSVWQSENIFLDFFGYLNTLHPSIKWTNETENKNKIATFDILILRPATSDRYIHYTSAQAWKEKASAIYIEPIQNAYPENTVWRILYQDKREKKQKEPFDVTKALHVPYHPRARRLYKILQEDFGLTISYKKTRTLGDIL